MYINLCNKSSKTIKEYNVKRHYQRKHSDFDENLKEVSDSQRQIIYDQKFDAFYYLRYKMSMSLTKNDLISLASLKIIWVLLK